MHVLFNVLVTLLQRSHWLQRLLQASFSPWSRDFLYGTDKVRLFVLLFFFFVFSFIHVLTQLVVAVHIYYLIPILLKYFIST